VEFKGCATKVIAQQGVSHMRRDSLLVVLCCIGVWTLSTRVATAQIAATSTVRGAVADSSGAALPGVSVTATLVSTKGDYRTVTNREGSYVLTGLRPGEYIVTFELAGFSRLDRAGVRLEVNEQGRVDVVMQVGALTDAVTVMGNASVVQTSNATLQTVVDSRRLVDLPLNGRQALQLQALTPGVVQVNEGQAASGIAVNTRLSFSINGSRPNGSSYYLDGGINMDMYNNLATSFPNPDALQEFSVVANSYGANYGRSAGGVINMVTKSGANNFGGSAYYFRRDDALNAKNYFSLTKPELSRNQYGGTIGGPVLRNRTFFFASFEGMREKNARTRSDIVVPTAAERRGDFSQSPLTSPVVDPATGTPFPGNQVPANRLDPVAQRFAAAFLPLPNGPGNTYIYNRLIPTNNDQFVVRADHNLFEGNRLTGRYFYDNFARENNAALLAFNSENRWRTKNFTLSDSHTFGSSVVNTATVTYAKNPFVRSPLPTADAKDWAALGCVSCNPTSPPGEPTDWNVSIARGLNVRVDTAFQSYMTNLHVVDTLSWATGDHLLSVGGEFGRFEREGHEYFSAAPTFAFDGLRSGSGWGYADFLLGVPRSVTQNSPLDSLTSRLNVAAYVQDDWKLADRVTVNLGLRYEPFLPIKEKDNKLSAFREGQQSTLYPLAPTGVLFPGDAGIGRGIVSSQQKVAPRVGVAYDPRGDGKASVRAAYGVFYDTIRLVALNGNNLNQPFTLGVTSFDPYSLTNPYLGKEATLALLQAYTAPSPGSEAARSFFLPVRANSIDPNFEPPLTHQWNVSVQRELPLQLTATIAYVGTRGRHLLVGQEINPAVYVPGASTGGNVDARRIHQGFTAIQNTQSTGHSDYDALQVSWNKRFSRGWSVLGSYVFSSSKDITSNDGNSGNGNSSSNPRDPEADYGPSDFDVPHRLVGSLIWELPFFNSGTGWARALLGGWQVNGIVTMQSGTPFSPMAGQNRSLVGGAGDRADLVGNAQVFSDRSQSDQVENYFDTTAFGLPALGTFGTAGRNSLRGPGYSNTDMTLQKLFRMADERALEVRFEVFNLFNNPNFLSPNNQFCSRTVASCNFGRLTSARDPRIMQVGARFRF
jgi:hypothetical protein